MGMILQNIKNRFRLISYLVIGIFAIIIATYGIYIVIIRTRAQSTCFTAVQIAADSRCFLIYNNGVYQKGTRANPHHGHACGSDVTSVIPTNHLLDKISYLDPNYKGELCKSMQPTTAPTQTLTQIPTTIPTNVPTNIPIPTPTTLQSNNPTVTPKPTLDSDNTIATPTIYLNNDPTAFPTQKNQISELPVSGIKQVATPAISFFLILVGIIGTVL